MSNKNTDLNLQQVFSINPTKHNIELLAKCFNYRGTLPQVVIDKIVSSYDNETKKFSNISMSVGDFYTGYESKPLVSETQLRESIAKMRRL